MFLLNYLLISAALILCLLTPNGNGDCYAAEYCQDVHTNITYMEGDSWTTSDCYRCYCWKRKIQVKSCLEIENRTSEITNWYFPSIRKSTLLSMLQARFRNAPREVIVTRNESLHIACPVLPDPVPNPITGTTFYPLLRQINYVLEILGKGCCSLYGYPASVHSDCESVWDPQYCRYLVLDRRTRQPCRYQYGLVGK
nr:uncharacterized protein LOC100183996 [Ciona intestinalis]|eukprot:XP_002124827.1 uncharacterized protein LOC100183996 [Ciona intestinalis]